MYEYEFPRPSISADVVVIRQRSFAPEILLIQRLKDPFANHWALPGGFMDINETVESSAVRELEEETGLIIPDVEQIGAFSAVDRDPRGRVITIAFFCELTDQQTAVAADDAKSVKWFPVSDLPPLAFDHDKIIAAARIRHPF